MSGCSQKIVKTVCRGASKWVYLIGYVNAAHQVKFDLEISNEFKCRLASTWAPIRA